jgi:pimeloyl-ACP methyl ester carboxylesterase
MATFVLVHGAWHGGWCWKKVAPLLRAVGHDVYTPTLTGLGERVHLASPDICLTTHIQDVVNVLAYEDLREVILVGHSYGGMVITGVADHLPERLAHLVYLDAFVPRDGECLLDLFPETARKDTLARARREGDGWRSPPQHEEQPFGVTAPADCAWVSGKLTPHPVKSWTEPVRRANPVALALPRTFIECTATGWFRSFAERARSEAGWTYRELPTGHDAMVTMPQELADRLLELIETCGDRHAG